jgi:hypothetical protein
MALNTPGRTSASEKLRLKSRHSAIWARRMLKTDQRRQAVEIQADRGACALSISALAMRLVGGGDGAGLLLTGGLGIGQTYLTTLARSTPRQNIRMQSVRRSAAP